MAAETFDNYGPIDNTESVTWFQRAANDSFPTSVAVGTAFRRALDRKNVAGGSRLGEAKIRWHLWPATFSPITATAPKPRDVIQDGSGVRWTILNVETAEVQSRYVCDTIRERP